jgi:uncharacterized protein YdhG (YjbR/CyaY superfamily)
MAFKFDVTVLLHIKVKAHALILAPKKGLAFECKAFKGWRLRTWTTLSA